MTTALPPILIIDDEKDNLDALFRLLRTQFQVTTTISPFEALKLIQTENYHVIISDQRMPEMTGVELLEKAKKLKPDTTRILLTGYTDIESVIDAINRGNIYRYISKPWDPDDLRMTLKQANDTYILRKTINEKNAELETALKELQVLDRAKAKFLSLVSHELNTPLTVLNSFVELLSEKQKEFSSDIQKSVSSIKNASSRFGEIVQEVLTYTKLEADQALKPGKIDWEKELKAAIEQNAKIIASKTLTLTIEKKEEPTASVDHGKIQLALNNLVSDTVERAPKGSQIILQLAANGLTLKRKGEALSPDAFEAFETSQNQMHHQKNLGLKLATVKLICDLHKAKVTAFEKDGWQEVTLSF